jgi:hypothetical protein
MAYPSTITSYTASSSAGTNLLSAPDHNLDHQELRASVIAVENKLGLSAGSAAANQLLVGQGAGTSTWGSVVNGLILGTPTLTGGTYTTPTITGGTANSQTLGTPTLLAPTINGQGTNSGTVLGGVYGTSTIQGGTINQPTLNVNQPVGVAVFSADVALGTGISVGSNASISPMGSSNNFSGLLIITDITDGNTGIFIVGGTPINLVSQTQASFTTTVNSANKTNVFINALPVYVTIQNLNSGTHTYSIMAFRTRVGL